MDGVFLGLAGLLLGISLGAAMPALGKPHPSLLFYFDLPNIRLRLGKIISSNTIIYVVNDT